MRPGKLRHRLTIQEFTETRDELGDPVETWKDVATVWGSIEPLSGREYYTAEQVNADVTHKVTIRYRAVEVKNRVLFGDRVFLIESILNTDERNCELVMVCREDV